MGVVTVNDSFYPWNDYPYDAFCRLLSDYKKFMVDFTPTNRDDDLRSGLPSRLMYWYPHYILSLYDCARQGIDFRVYLDSFHPYNKNYFEAVFVETTKTLDKLLEGHKTNFLDEYIIKNGKLK